MADEQQMVLRTEDLVKKYRTRTVVNHVSINVKQGEIVGLLGPNGAGKTTTFYMTVGLVTPNEGKIFLNDKEITNFPVYMRARHGIGYLAQEASIFRKMTVEDNIRAVLEMTDTDAAYQKEKLESLLTEFGLHKVRKNLGDQLSGGERRRAEIARCLRKQKPAQEHLATLAELHRNVMATPKHRPRLASNLDLESMLRQLDGEYEAIDFLTDEGDKVLNSSLMRHVPDLVDLIDGKSLEFRREKNFD